MRFRPCIDLHEGKVRQIVGASLGEQDHDLRINYTSDLEPAHYATLYRQDNLEGGHVIMLGPGNEAAATEALAAWPGGMQVGGGITAANCRQWLDRGASHVIVTSHVFHDGILDEDRLRRLVQLTGSNRLVLDLSCRWRQDGYYVVTNRWQRFTKLRIEAPVLERLSRFCAEFLVHAVDVEGQCLGVDRQLLAILAQATPIPTTYAGGIASMADLELIRDRGQGRIDATVGSALDIFGGTGLTYRQVVQFHQQFCQHIPHER